jgi:hypothetical protein
VAYKVQLPPAAQIHPVIHVSQLNKALPRTTQVSSDDNINYLLMDISTNTPQVLDTCLKKIGNSAIRHVLVQWQSWPSTWATWENKNTIMKQGG